MRGDICHSVTVAAPRVHEVVADRRDQLTPAERRVADVVVGDPELVAFGTVAEVARAAGASGASVVRLATRLGFDGYAELQERVQAELARRLRPATERIREPATADTVGRVLQASLDAVHGTLDAVDRPTFDRVVAKVASRAATLWVVCGDASEGIGSQAAGQLANLRPKVAVVSGSPVRTVGLLASVEKGDVVLTLDLRRYDAWLVDWVARAKERGATVIALTDSHVSSLAALADELLVVAADSAGPFDTYVGAVALFDAIIAGVARKGRAAATASLDRIEDAWSAADVLME